jgi:serine/threonine protein phosphatase 1
MRTFAIGDIHGYLHPLQALIDSVSPARDDLLIFLGDYVDKGPDVKGVIDYLLTLSETHQTVFLRGNHDQMMLDAHRDAASIAFWECLGGTNPLASYGRGTLPAQLQMVPESHWEFLEDRCRNFFETPEFIFVHGGVQAHVSPSEEDPERLLWATLGIAEQHFSGRTVICGHSAQKTGIIADLGHTICVDTGITHGGWLTCLALETLAFWQVNADGARRKGVLRGENELGNRSGMSPGRS